MLKEAALVPSSVGSSPAISGVIDSLIQRRSAARFAVPSNGAHLVQFYDSDEFLVETVAHFIGAGLAAGAGAIVVATAQHSTAVRRLLGRNSFDVARAEKTGQLTLLDAHELLAELLIDGQPDSARFDAIVRPLVERSGRGRSAVRGYGEMVDVLCREGKHSAALELERLWNGLIDTGALSLLCGYSMAGFANADDADRFRHVCRAHGHVAPADGFADLEDDDARLREISELQQRARALQTEVEQRKVLEGSLRQREAELQGFLANAAESIHLVGPDGKIIWANRAELELLGYSADEYFGCHVADFHVDAQVIDGILSRLVNGEELRSVEARLRAKDGSIRHVLISSNVYRHAGEFVHTRCFTRDITERKAAEEELKEQQRITQTLLREMEIASRTKDDFLATVSHELRTPLNAMLGWTRMLRSGLVGEAQREKALETIERNANAQVQLIEDLLDVSRIISGKMRLELRSVDIAQVVANAIEAVRPAANAKGVELVRFVDGALEPIVADGDRMQQVVWNLLNNAVKFTPAAGRVSIEARKSASGLEIIVADNGQGIDPEFLPYVFERFRQADSTKTRKHMGLGLGLAIVRHLVELHGGGVKVESEGRGKGARFVVALPASALVSNHVDELPAVRRAAAVPQFARPPELAGVHVLILEDDSDAREMLLHALAPCNARVSVAPDARTARLIFEHERPDVIVSDIGLPGEDGYQFIKEVRSLPPSRGGKTPAVALTAYARAEDRTQALVAGFNLHMTKPVEPAQLMAVLATLSTSREPAS
jgi:PAS domain S-box-containing protein